MIKNVTDEERYRIDNLHSRSLENNPLDSPVDRKVHVYLPPDYFEGNTERYPVIYMLHGYDGSWTKPIIAAHLDKLWKNADIKTLATYQAIDEAILSGTLSPFILAQPDASLHLPAKGEARDFFTGEIRTKGSFYVNSPYTGNYDDYIIYDVVSYIDANYRTVADRQFRSLCGGSMGGYGALSLGLNHPDTFCCLASLSPANMGLQALSWELIMPFLVEIYGIDQARKIGRAAWDDIIDTRDMIHSQKDRLLPTRRLDEDGNLLGYDEKAAESWEKYNLNNMIRQKPDAYWGVQIMLCCECQDEYGFASETTTLHQTLVSEK